MRISLFSSALVAALVGYGSTIALLLAAAQAVGATPAQTGSWIFAICLAKAAGSAFLSLRARMPVVLAWSTPGAALVAASQGLSMAETVAAFLFAGLLIALTGALRPLGRVIAALPDPVAAAMLAGVLLPFCLAVPGHAAAAPALILPVIAVFLAVRLVSPAQAVLAALATGLVLGFALPGAADMPALTFTLPRLTFIAPDWNLGVLIGLGLPLYLVTMASQNLPGFAVLRAAGYTPPVRPTLVVTGGLSAVSSVFGAHTISLAAITAAICLGEDVHPDRSQRWKVGLVYAGIWVALGLSGPVILALIGAMPAPLVATIAGLALIAPFLGAASSAFAVLETRFAAGTTMIVTASGVAVFGIGAAFWGLITGLLVLMLEKAGRRPV